MKKIIKNIRDKIDPRPGLPTWIFAVHCYAMDMLESYIDTMGLTIWDDVDQISTLTENDLLNNAQDWQQYSKAGNALIWTTDISRRLFDTSTPPVSPNMLILLQGIALEQAAGLILQAVHS